MDTQKRIPLHWAAAKGHVNVISLLIQHGSDPDAADGRGLKPIHLATKKNHAAAVTTLLEVGVEPNTIKTKENHAGRLMGGEPITTGECSILYATRAGYLETIVAMISFCKGKVLEQLLCQCCRYNRTDAALAILEHSNVSADATFEGATALYFACGSVNAVCVEALINRGADVHKTSEWLPRYGMIGGISQREEAKHPLHRLVQEWSDANNAACQQVLKLLINANVDMGQLDGRGNSALLRASGGHNTSGSRVHLHAMRSLLEAGADVKVTTTKGDTLLHMLLQRSHNLEAARLLVDYGCDLNQLSADGKSPLQNTIDDLNVSGREHTESIVKYLVECGAKITSAIVERFMSRVGVEVFRLLLLQCENDAVMRQCWFKIPHLSPIEKFIEYLEFFLAQGMDIETRTADGRTLYLCSLNSKDQCDVLRSHGAKTDVMDNTGNNPLHLLASREHYYLRQRMETLIEEGLDPLAKNNNGDTLLHRLAAWYNYEPKSAEIVRWIVSFGISVNAVNRKGLTALHVSQRASPIRNKKDNVHLVQVVNCNNDLDLELQDNSGLTVLHIAAMQNSVQLRTLLAAGANLNALTKDSQNVLHLACRAKKINLVGHLLDLLENNTGAINHKDAFGRAPLHYASASGQAETVRLLLERGANAKALDKTKRTTLHACAEFRLEQNIWETRNQSHTRLRGPPADDLRPGSTVLQREQSRWYLFSHGRHEQSNMRNNYSPMVGTVVKMLLDAGCSPSAIDCNKYSALDTALDTGCVEFFEPFIQDEDLFLKVTAYLGEEQYSGDRADLSRSLIKAQMELTRPRPALPVLENNTAAFDAIRQSPHRFLGLLHCEDAARIINEGFEANPADPIHYKTVTELMVSGYVQIIERVPNLVKHYSSEESLVTMIEKAKASGERNYTSSAKTALQIACQRQEPNMVVLQLLVDKLRVDVNAHSALLSGEEYQKNREMHSGATALHIVADASHWWQLGAMKYLIENGADVDSQDEKGLTPLHVTAHGTKYEAHAKHTGLWRCKAARELLGQGANPNAVDKAGRTPLHVSSSCPEIMKLLLERKADASIGKSPLFLAIYDQNLEALETILDHGLSVNSVNEKAHSREVHHSLKMDRTIYALLCTGFAAKINTHPPQSVPLLRALVERGADLYPPLNDEETLIHFLFEYPEYEVLDALLTEPCASRIDLNRRDQRGRTVLIAACDWHQVIPGHGYRHWSKPVPSPALRMLEMGADATIADNDGKTALHHILANDGLPDWALIEFINHKATAPILFQKDNDGFLPFHYALRTLRPKVCELILEKGADLLDPGPDGRTALHYIADQCLKVSREPLNSNLDQELPEDYLDQCLTLWKRFIDEGGSINVADNQGNSPLLAFLLSQVRGLSRRKAPEKEPGRCHVETFEKLFPPDSGVDMFAAHHAGETGLHMVAKRLKTYHTKEGHDKALFEAMMAKGLDPLKEDAKGRSALDVADAYGRDEIVGIVRRK
jgi:ankyrin repeat protein